MNVKIMNAVAMAGAMALGLSACKKADGPQAEAQAPAEAAAAQAETKAEDHYTCPMHPEVHQDHPGSCPKCHMDLVKKKG